MQTSPLINLCDLHLTSLGLNLLISKMASKTSTNSKSIIGATTVSLGSHGECGGETFLKVNLLKFRGLRQEDILG